MAYSPFRQLLSTLLFIAVLALVLFCNYMLIHWGFGHVIVAFIHLFPGRKLALKLLFIVGGFTIVFLAVFLIFVWIAGKINKILDYIFIYNRVCYYISIFMVLASIAFSVVDMLTLLTRDLWSIIVWLLTLYFVWQMNWVFVFRDRYEPEDKAGTYPNMK